MKRNRRRKWFNHRFLLAISDSSVLFKPTAPTWHIHSFIFSRRFSLISGALSLNIDHLQFSSSLIIMEMNEKYQCAIKMQRQNAFGISRSHTRTHNIRRRWIWNGKNRPTEPNWTAPRRLGKNCLQDAIAQDRNVDEEKTKEINRNRKTATEETTNGQEWDRGKFLSLDFFSSFVSWVGKALACLEFDPNMPIDETREFQS